MARTLAELRQSCEQHQAGEIQISRDLRDEITLLTRQNDAYEAEWRRMAAEHNRLQAALVPRPGSEVLAAFPAGPASLELGLLGLAALACGFLLGLPGRRQRRERLLSGAVSGLIALFASLGSIALLPDTRRPELLFALTAALLLVSLRTLLRVWLRQRRSAPAAP